MRTLICLLLTGCTTANVELPNGKVSFTRFATDAAVTLNMPDGSSLNYSSSPSAVAQQQSMDTLTGLLRSVLLPRVESDEPSQTTDPQRSTK